MGVEGVLQGTPPVNGVRSSLGRELGGWRCHRTPQHRLSIPLCNQHGLEGTPCQPAPCPSLRDIAAPTLPSSHSAEGRLLLWDSGQKGKGPSVLALSAGGSCQNLPEGGSDLLTLRALRGGGRRSPRAGSACVFWEPSTQPQTARCTLTGRSVWWSPRKLSPTGSDQSEGHPGSASTKLSPPQSSLCLSVRTLVIGFRWPGLRTLNYIHEGPVSKQSCSGVPSAGSHHLATLWAPAGTGVGQQGAGVQSPAGGGRTSGPANTRPTSSIRKLPLPPSGEVAGAGHVGSGSAPPWCPPDGGAAVTSLLPTCICCLGGGGGGCRRQHLQDVDRPRGP